MRAMFRILAATLLFVCSTSASEGVVKSVGQTLTPAVSVKKGEGESAVSGAFSSEQNSSVRQKELHPASDRLRLIIETDAGGDPDDEQSLVRFLLYANEWDVEGIIANRSRARDGENLNPERTGLGI